jgi:hypothetical protein
MDFKVSEPFAVPLLASSSKVFSSRSTNCSILSSTIFLKFAREAFVSFIFLG